MIAVTPAEIAKAGAALRSYDYGRTTEAPDQIDAYLRRSAGQPEVRGWLEQEMVKTLESDAPYGAKKFACEKLWMVGSDKAVPTLSKLLAGADPHLAEAACYAISRRPSAAADTVLRQALAEAKDRTLLAIVNLTGDRRDPQCVPKLAELASHGNAATAAAAAQALGKIATPEAVAALRSLHTPAASAALLQAAQELDRAGDGAAAEGFHPLFNGRDLSDFHVDTASLWSVRNGVIVGSSPGLKYNEFLRTKTNYANFILRGKLRLIDGYGNSGFQFRSVPVPDSHEVSGYQADAGERYWGSLYDESRRRKTLAGPDAAFLDKLDPAAWHSYVVHAAGSRIRIELDGVETVNYEEHEPGIAPDGFIALQVHATPRPSEVWFRDLRIRVL